MFERFKRTEPTERSSTGGVTTAERPRMNDGTLAEDRPAEVEDRPADVEDRPADVEDRPADVEDRPAAVEDRPTAVEDRPVDEDRTLVHDHRHFDDDGAPTAVAGAETMRHVRARQRAEFGGFNWGAAFFGWLVSVGVAALLVGLLAGAGAAVGLTETTNADITQNAEEITLGGGIVLVVALLIAYFSGGYVAGRMSRFDGARQGIGVWIFGLIVTIALAILAVVAGSDYNVLERLDLPRIPIDEGTLTTGGIIALVAIVLGTLLAAAGGGRAGENYHRKVDRAGFET